MSTGVLWIRRYPQASRRGSAWPLGEEEAGDAALGPVADGRASPRKVCAERVQL